MANPTTPAPEREEAKSCGHDWQYGGLRYRDGYQIAGSSARTRYYADWFYCRKCLADAYFNERAVGTSYDAIIPGAPPR